MNLKDFIKKQLHLPRFLRDFHDQKDVFKSVDRHMGRDDPPYGVPWTAGQCFVIDRFLKFMAYHGWTLQRSRTKCDFCDLNETLKSDRDEEIEALKQFLGKPNADQTASQDNAPNAS